MKLQTIFQRRWKFPEPFTQRNIYIWNLLPTESSETWHGLYMVGGGWGTHIAGWDHAVLCRQPYIKALVSRFQLDKLTIKEMHPHISQCVLREYCAAESPQVSLIYGINFRPDKMNWPHLCHLIIMTLPGHKSRSLKNEQCWESSRQREKKMLYFYFKFRLALPALGHLSLKRFLSFNLVVMLTICPFLHPTATSTLSLMPLQPQSWIWAQGRRVSTGKAALMGKLATPLSSWSLTLTFWFLQTSSAASAGVMFYLQDGERRPSPNNSQTHLSNWGLAGYKM